jgi:hypothetical protein
MTIYLNPPSITMELSSFSGEVIAAFDFQLGDPLQDAILSVIAERPNFEGLNEPQSAWLREINFKWDAAMLLILHRQSNKFDAATWKSIASDFEIFHVETWAGKLRCQLDLCRETLDLFPLGVFPYQSGVEWWQKLMIEAKRDEFKSPLLNNNGGKERWLKTLKTQLSILKNCENPVPANQLPELFNFFQAVITVAKHDRRMVHPDFAKQRNKFRRDWWQPYINAYRKWVNYLSKCPDLGVIKATQHSLRIPIGGRSELTIFHSAPKGFTSGRGRKSK